METVPPSGPRSALAEVDAAGAFKRTPSNYRHTIGDSEKVYKPEAGRYHLYISLACPWANRCLAVLNLKGLREVIGVTTVHPTWRRSRPNDPNDQHCGWFFHDSSTREPVASATGHGAFVIEGCTPDPVNNCNFVRDLYDLVNDTNGKYTVPVLWDKKTSTIVNNESSEIIRICNSSFNDFATNKEIDLYPADETLRAEIDERNDVIYHTINDGVYRCGFAKTQEAYDLAVSALFASLDALDELLATRRYLTGSLLTEADVRLFMTLIRFDEVYIVYFKTSNRFISSYKHLRNYCRDLYQIPAIGSSIDMSHIKTHYFSSHPQLNPFAIVPAGPGVIADLQLPHDRNRSF